MTETAVATAPKQPVVNEGSRWIALYVLCVGMLMIVLDATIVNVALPSIQDDLGFSQSSLAWVVNAYLVGLAVFTTASLICGLSQSQGMLIAARFAQGAGGALASAVILGMIVTMFPEPREQAKAIGVYSFVASAGASIGLLLGGFLTQGISWHWIFFVNIPIGIATAVLAWRLVGKDRGIGLAGGADVAGAVLVTSALMLGVYTIVKAADFGWGDLHTLGFGALSVALLGAFVAREATAGTPLMPLRIFRFRNVTGANLVQILMVAGLFGMFFLGVLYLQDVLGYDAIETGVAFLPVSLTIGVLSLGFSARLNMRFGARATLLPGLVLIVAGLALFARAPVDGTYVVDVLPVMLLLGVGAGLSFPSLMTLAMSGATPSDSGLSSGLVNTSLQVGGALGLAVLATLSSTRTDSLLADGEGRAEALTGGYHLAFIVAAGLVTVAVIAAATVLQPSAAVEQEVEEANAQALTEAA
jgi:EmrB/QacA subfamily drug resistance transporter